MTRVESGPLTAPQRASYQHDGYLVLRGVFSPAEISALDAEADWLLKRRGGHRGARRDRRPARTSRPRHWFAVAANGQRPEDCGALLALSSISQYQVIPGMPSNVRLQFSGTF